MNLNKLNWEIAAGTETGYVRKENQDRMSWAQVPWGQLYIVADGIGGHAGGARAAELTVQGLELYLAEASEEIRIDDAIRDAFAKPIMMSTIKLTQEILRLREWVQQPSFY